MLRPGCPADLIVTDPNPLAVTAGEIGDPRVLLTLPRGRAVHHAAGFGG